MVPRSAARESRSDRGAGLEVGQQLVDHGCVARAHGRVEAVGRALPVEEPAPLPQRVAQREHVECVTARGHGEDVGVRLAQDAQPVDGARTGDDAAGGVDRGPGEAAVPLLAQEVEDGPRRRDRPAGLGPGHARRRVHPAEPAVEGERLVATQLLRPVEHDRRALGRVPELVEVDRDRRHPVDPEVPGRDRVAELLEEREHHAAHARVGVEAGTHGGGERGEFRDRVDDTLRVLRRGTDDERGAVGHGRGHGLDVGAEVVTDGNRDRA